MVIGLAPVSFGPVTGHAGMTGHRPHPDDPRSPPVGMSRCRSTPGHDPPAVPGPSPTVASCRQQVPSCGLCSTRIGRSPPHPHHFRRIGQARFPASRARDLRFGWEAGQRRSASHDHPGRPVAPPSEALSAGAPAATKVPTDVRHHSLRDDAVGSREDARRIGTRNASTARPTRCDEKNTRPRRTFCLLIERSERCQPPSKPIQPAYLNGAGCCNRRARRSTSRPVPRGSRR